MNVTIGTPFKPSAVKVLLCGSGELGKEVVIELQRYGVEVIAADAYADAPAMQVADRAHVFSMLDGAALRKVIEMEKPDFVVPEVEAIATDTLADLEKEGLATIIPTARATQLTMNREGIRRLAAEELGLKTSPYRFAATEEEFTAALEAIRQHGASASAVILVEGESDNIRFGNLGAALSQPDVQLRLFGKPAVKGKRRMGVAVARGASIEEARDKARKASNAVDVQL